MEMQRLVKYPMLLEAIAKYSPQEPSHSDAPAAGAAGEPSSSAMTDEIDKLQRATQKAKDLLTAVNSAKQNSENLRRLRDLQENLDTTPFDKDPSHTLLTKKYKQIDLTQYTLIHDGPLQWRLNKGKHLDVHLVLLDSMLVLLTRVDSHNNTNSQNGCRLVLKMHDSPTNKDQKWCPVMRLSQLMVKEVATGINSIPLTTTHSTTVSFADKKAFFLLYTATFGSQIYEMCTTTSADQKRLVIVCALCMPGCVTIT